MFVVRGKSGKVVGKYATRAEAERRIAQLKAGAARLRPFAFGRGARSPSTKGDWETGAHSHGANDLILFAYNTGTLYPEKKRIIELLKGTVARGVYDPAMARSTWNRWLMKAQAAYRRELRGNGLRETTGVVARQDAAKVIERCEHDLIKNGEYGPVGAHSWKGQPRRHAKAAKLGQRRHARRYSHSPSGKVETVTILGKRWFDRKNGNTYYTADILVNGRHVHKLPYDYGYGDHYRDEAAKWLIQNGYIQGTKNPRTGSYPPLWQLAQAQGIHVEASHVDVPRKKDL
jgi:hypothetical protein